MKRKIILNLAMSLDGYIAEVDGGFDWIVGHDGKNPELASPFDFTTFAASCDTIVMGRKAFDDCGIENIPNYQKKKFIVATFQDREHYDNVEFISGDVCRKIMEIRNECGKDIWLFGGAGLTDNFMEQNIIDEYIIGIIPVILGSGVRLFNNNHPMINLHLEAHSVFGGVAMLKYTKRK